METFQTHHRDFGRCLLYQWKVEETSCNKGLPHQHTRCRPTVPVAREIMFPYPLSPNSSNCVWITSYCVCIAVYVLRYLLFCKHFCLCVVSLIASMPLGWLRETIACVNMCDVCICVALHVLCLCVCRCVLYVVHVCAHVHVCLWLHVYPCVCVCVCVWQCG